MVLNVVYTTVVTKKGQRTYPVSSGNIVTFGVTRSDYNRAKKGVLFKYPAVVADDSISFAYYLQTKAVRRTFVTEKDTKRIIVSLVFV